jgi:hypothetical protein
MSFESAKVILVVVAVFSQVAMINHAKATDQEKGDKPSIFYNPLRTADYIRITKAERGRIGLWFWTFLASMVFLFTIVVFEIATGR